MIVMLQAELNSTAEQLRLVRDEVEDLRMRLQEAGGDHDATARRVSELEAELAQTLRDVAIKLERAEVAGQDAVRQAEAMQSDAAAELAAAR